VAGGSFERLDGVQWRQSAQHRGSLSLEKLRQGRETMLCEQ
jgi:hypothetical protein